MIKLERISSLLANDNTWKVNKQHGIAHSSSCVLREGISADLGARVSQYFELGSLLPKAKCH